MSLSSTLSTALSALSCQSGFRPPKLVVVGTQSSGKSSLLNALIGVQLLPTGETMTTRAAVQVELVHADEGDSAPKVEFGTFVDGEWCTSRTLTMHDPPTPQERSMVQNHISTETIRLLGGGGGVLTHTSICIRLVSTSVPNMCFVDLPGITMHALKSAGQPEDMCEQIRGLIRSYVDERTIVLMVCAARADLEADAAVDMCMSMTSGRRVIGCLTKTDLCDSPDSILSYLSDSSCPCDLTVEYGYYAVKCRTDADQALADVYRTEAEFFKTCVSSSSPAGSRLGVPCLASRVHGIVTRAVEECLPDLRRELMVIRDAAAAEYASKLKRAIPDTERERHAFVNDMLVSFSNSVTWSVVARKPDASVGRTIRRAFSDLRETLRCMDPLSHVPDSEIADAVLNCEGWSMNSPVPPVEIVEYFMQHRTHRPIHRMMTPCTDCLHAVRDVVLAESRRIGEEILGRFVRLRAWAEERTIRLVAEQVSTTTEALTRLLDVEEAYIFTDNVTFVKEWTSVTQKLHSNQHATALKSVLTSYFSVVADGVASQVPKLIVYHLRMALKDMQAHLQAGLREPVSDASHLLFESNEIEELRERITSTLRTSERCLASVDEALSKCANANQT